MNLKIQKLEILFGIALVLIISSIMMQNQTNNSEQQLTHEDDEKYPPNDVKSPISSGSWILNSIHIDDSGASGNGTWAGWAQGKPWCTGLGTKNDPYIIQNVTIDGENKTDCILIKNSIKYFIIRNCTLFNARNSDDYSGIRLDNVDNGRIIDNNCSNNAINGITLINGCQNNTIHKNIVIYNTIGIFLKTNCIYNTISNNTACNNLDIGICLNNCNNNTISNNSACNNENIGICLVNNCCYNSVVNNNASSTQPSGQDKGINVWNGCSHNIISNNIVLDTAWWGIGVQEYSAYNTLLGNFINNSYDFGIYIQYSANTTVSENVVSNVKAGTNGIGIDILDLGSDSNLVYNNSFINNKVNAKNWGKWNKWNNSVIGNYWSNYIGKDVNDDGIGDTPYTSITGFSGGTDYRPIFWDAPVFKVDKPINGTTYITPPQYNITMKQGVRSSTWYSIYSRGRWSQNCTGPANGTIDSDLWATIPNGTIKIRFYVSDSRGWINKSDASVKIIRYELYSIHIDDLDTSGNGTWYEINASSSGWCRGSGTSIDPYIIEYVWIDGGGTGDCILVGNSSVHFIIRYCTLFNAQSGGNYSGIRLNNVDNGQLIKNNCSNNARNGITLHNGCVNNIIFKNRANKNLFGIYLLKNCENNNVSNNNVSANTDSGINLGTNCNKNNISNNIACNNGAIGIQVVTNCWYNSIINNNASNSPLSSAQKKGINLWSNCDYNNISNNIIINNTWWGMGLQSGSDNNTVSGNTILDTVGTTYGWGLYLDSSSYNNFTENTIKDTTGMGHGIHYTSGNYNNFWKNYFIKNTIHANNWGTTNKYDNGTIGNYWDDYTGKDANDDGIGDTSYATGGTAATDHFPIWWDAPVFTINEPYNTTIYTEVPNYNIIIVEGVRHTSWYSVNSSGLWSQNYTFTSLVGTINSNLWASIPNGNITIRFFVNDSRGLITYHDISMTKYAYGPVDDDDDDSADDDQTGATTQDNALIFVIIAVIGGAIALGGGVIFKKRKSRIGERVTESVGDIKDKLKETVQYKIKDAKEQVDKKTQEAREHVEEKGKKATPKEKTFDALIKKTKYLSEEALNAKEKANFKKAQDNWTESLDLLTQAKAMATILSPESVQGIDKVIKSLQENIQNLNIEKEYQGAAEKIEMANKQIDKKNFELAHDTLKKAKISIVKSIEVAKQVKAESILKNLQKVQSDVEEAIKNYDSGKMNLITPITYKLTEIVAPLAISAAIGTMLFAQPGLKLKTKKEEAPKKLTEKEKKELQKTEKEVAVKKEDFICIVHKGAIQGDDIYLCPYCHTLYCTKCAKTLKENGESCWSCGSEITVSSMIRVESKTQQKIQELEKNLETLKNTIKMLDDNFYTGAIDETEYNSMKTPAMRKIAETITKIKEMKEERISKQKSKHIDVSRGGDWMNEGNQSVFYYKVKVHNISEFTITNVHILLTSIPAGLEAVKGDKQTFNSLNPDAYVSPTFKLLAKESCVGNVIEALVTYSDPKGKTNTFQVRPFEIRYVCNLLIPKQVTREEFRGKTENMEVKVLSIESNIPLNDLEEMLTPIVSNCNFAIMPKDEKQSDESRMIEGFAEGLYDKEEVAFSIELIKESGDATQVNIKAMSTKLDKLTDLIRDFNFKLDDIKSDTQIIKDYTAQIEDIFDKTEDIETLLKESLGNEYIKMQRYWEDYKAGKIGKKELIVQGLKLFGKKFAKSIIQKFI